MHNMYEKGPAEDMMNAIESIPVSFKSEKRETRSRPFVLSWRQGNSKLTETSSARARRCAPSRPHAKAYVGLCELFLVLCPHLHHFDQKNFRDQPKTCDYASWSSRGWCRAECAARVLSKGDSSVIVIESPSRAHIAPPSDTLVTMRAGAGDFTVEADKEKIAKILQIIMEQNVSSSEAKENPHRARENSKLTEISSPRSSPAPVEKVQYYQSKPSLILEYRWVGG